jgi:hypothetical protein
VSCSKYFSELIEGCCFIILITSVTFQIFCPYMRSWWVSYLKPHVTVYREAIEMEEILCNETFLEWFSVVDAFKNVFSKNLTFKRLCFLRLFPVFTTGALCPMLLEAICILRWKWIPLYVIFMSFTFLLFPNNHDHQDYLVLMFNSC